MKILYVSQYFPPEMGAPAARAAELSRHWAKSGHDISVLTGFPNHPTGVIPPEYRSRARRMVARVIAIVAFGAVVACGTRTKHDYKALCDQQCACEACTVDDCIADRSRLGDENAARGCAAEWTAIEACETAEGGSRCEHAAGMVQFMPQDKCRPPGTILHGPALSLLFSSGEFRRECRCLTVRVAASVN